MPMLAELVDAVVGVDTHRDTHQVEIALPTGAPIATCTITNDTRGYAGLLAFIADHTPGPRLAVSIEGTRSYGSGVTRAVRRRRAGGHRGRAAHPQDPPRRGKSDPIDAHLAVHVRPATATSTGCPPPAPTATATPCGSCSAPATTSP